MFTWCMVLIRNAFVYGQRTRNQISIYIYIYIAEWQNDWTKFLRK